MPRHPNKEMRQLLKPLVAQGYTLRLGGSHYLLLDPEGKTVRMDGGLPVVIPSSPSDWRGQKNLVSRLRQLALVN